MNAAPTPAPKAAPLARLDLRTGLTACRVAAAEAPVASAAALLRCAADALEATSEAAPDRRAPLCVAIAADLALDPEALRAAAADLDPARMVLQIEETDLIGVTAGAAALGRLRAQGWGLALRSAASCGLPFSSRLARMFCEVIAPDAPDDPAAWPAAPKPPGRTAPPSSPLSARGPQPPGPCSTPAMTAPMNASSCRPCALQPSIKSA